MCHRDITVTQIIVTVMSRWRKFE